MKRLPTVTCSIKPHLLSPPITAGVTRSTGAEILQITTLNVTKRDELPTQVRLSSPVSPLVCVCVEGQPFKHQQITNNNKNKILLLLVYFGACVVDNPLS